MIVVIGFASLAVFFFVLAFIGGIKSENRKKQKDFEKEESGRTPRIYYSYKVPDPFDTFKRDNK